MKIRLDDLPLDKKYDSKGVYVEELADLQLELLHYQRILKESKRTLIFVFEGPDAAGKGGVIKRLAEKLDPRQVRVYSIIKPTPEEMNHPYLWRFWTKIPQSGEIAVVDRSWYGRLMVERVEKFATEDEWSRAYDEINNFEKYLTDNGAILMKFYLHISKDEQLRRFRSREADPYKHWKINDEDWRNRRKWNVHNQASEDAFAKTSTQWAPWEVLGSNYKWWMRVAVMRKIIKRLDKELKK